MSHVNAAPFKCRNLCNVLLGIGSDADNLYIAYEDGGVYHFHPSSSSYKMICQNVLEDNEMYCRLCPLSKDKLLIVTSLGKVFLGEPRDSVWSSKVILDDRVLVPGPILLSQNDHVILTKFNQVYVFDLNGSVLFQNVCPDLFSEIKVLLPLPGHRDKFVVLSRDSCGFIFDMNIQKIDKMESNSWRQEMKRLRLGHHDEDAEKECHSAVKVIGASASPDKSSICIVETTICEYPEIPQSFVNLYGLFNAERPLSASKSNLPSKNQRCTLCSSDIRDGICSRGHFIEDRD